MCNERTLKQIIFMKMRKETLQIRIKIKNVDIIKHYCSGYYFSIIT